MGASMNEDEKDTVRGLIEIATGYSISDEWGESVYRFEFDSFCCAEISLKIWAFDMDSVQARYPGILNRFNNGGA